MKAESKETKADIREMTAGKDFINNPIQLTRSLKWSFLPPIFAALIYGVCMMFIGLNFSAATSISVVFMALLLGSTDKQDFDWYGFCFVTGGVALFCIGSPIAFLFGVLAFFFAILTLIDADTGKSRKRKMALMGLYLFNGALASLIFLLPAWTSFGLIFLYGAGILMVFLVPLGLAAKASFQDASE